ncbi:RISC-loading complex subunit tarbp2-like isoform X2 [Amphibalanus amphitrite]|uniref:RISC-loading complex subunit tarbp2-like isoform X2 n=1 Tax=Amphibalanus amphitrite TaxID=1232801 RepID=UPI001C913C05|nr:RISC-loading complex subunit tarbp2-like isoform X2 [Amphibalanus amphitrite]XP_043210513.1 RISC-loading complex subunit tarbp2-like isoform X2 [Amphibalanus amphitrite]XP_043210521.1 RISC-loading complex subunit tarbp2-like isoform X2 [Amphibalanus amphitrite]XP_043210528.1 RISC-loading complex subunit tarbp2-like isoform X2 [Amphibalanus amphitrite]
MNMQSNAPNGVASSMNGASMPTMPTKTPVSLLQELCAKRGITPKYDLIQVEGAVHQPTFLYKATVGEFMATGQGQSKKKAKHAVAKAVLDLVLGNQAAPPGAPMAPVQADSLGQLVSPYDDGIAGNPVGQLQELCMAYRLPPPVYEPVSEQGLPHERTFTIACRIGTALSETGVGKSKKIAKRQASNLLLTKLRELPPPPAAESADPAAAGGETMDQRVACMCWLTSQLSLDGCCSGPRTPPPTDACSPDCPAAGGALFGPAPQSDPLSDGVRQRAGGPVPPWTEGGHWGRADTAQGPQVEPGELELPPVPAGSGEGAELPVDMD